MRQNVVRRWLACSCTLQFAVSAAIAVGQSPMAQFTARVSAIVTDRSGAGIADLRADDLRVFEDGSRQPVGPLKLERDRRPRNTVILFDLMDLSLQQRAYATVQFKRSLANAAVAVPLGLYLLVPDGTLYPVHALQPGATDGNAWISNIGPLLDDSLTKVHRVRPLNLTADRPERVKTVYAALEAMDRELAGRSGVKQLLWITYGIPSGMRLAGEGWVDLAPILRQLGAQFNRNQITVYTLDPSLNLGSLNRDGLDILTRSTGGQTFFSSDLEKALRDLAGDAASSYVLEYPAARPSNDPGGRFHTVRVTAVRKGIRLRSQQVYVSGAAWEAGDSVKTAAPVASAKTPAPVSESQLTFVGSVETAGSRSIVLRLDDARFVTIDFRGEAPASLHPGDRVRAKGNEYDGRGILADSLALLEKQTGGTGPKQAPGPAPSGASDPVIEGARKAVREMAQSLPDYICRESVRRFENWPQHKEWQLQDKLSTEVIYSTRSGEHYRDIQVDGKPTEKPWRELGGDISTGEFGSLLNSLFSIPEMAFLYIADETVDGVAAQLYGFEVAAAQSDWKILIDYQYIVPRYSGRIWVARDSHRVLKIVKTAREIPAAFPLSSVEVEVTFGEAALGSFSRTFLLPVRAETGICIREGQGCRRKSIDFIDYRKFSAESTVEF